MTEKERQEIIELVHKTLRGFFEPFPEGELGCRPFTQTEKVLLEVNKALCEKIKEMPTVEPKHGEWIKGKEISRTMLCDKTVHIDYKDFTCSACGLVLDRLLYHVDGSPFYNFCPNCGSDNRPRENNSSSMIINGKYSENVEYGTRVEIQKRR